MKRLFPCLVAGTLWVAGSLPVGAAPPTGTSYFINLPPGFSLIANQLDNGGNTLAEVLPMVPEETTLLKWNCTNQEYSATLVFFTGLGWVDMATADPAGDVTLSPGEGAFLYNPSSASALTFVGTPHIPVFPPPMACGCGQTNLLSRQTNSPGNYENILGESPVEGSQVSRFVAGNFLIYTFSSGVWAPSVPTLGVGESAFFYTPCVTAPDVEPPFIVSLNTVTNRSIGLCFSEPVTLVSATNSLNYTVNGGSVGVVSVVLRPDAQSVAILLDQPIGEFFSVVVTNVADLVGNSALDAKSGFVSPYASTTVGTPGDPSPAGTVYTCFPDSFEVTVGGTDIGGTNDHFHFIDQTVVGDFDLRARVTRLDPADPESKAGLVARESLAADSRTLQTYFTPVPGSNQVQVSVRSVTGGTTERSFQIGPNAPADPLRWLRISRSNDVFTTYHGTNGLDWTASGITTQAFNTTLRVGLAVSSHTNGQATTASFADFRVDGMQPGDELIPTSTVALSTTNLVLNWLRTPRDFAVEVSTNLIEWSLLLLPIRQGPGPAERSMVIPIEPGAGQLFARLTRVARVIPIHQSAVFAPAATGSGVTPGIILSPDNGLKTTSSSANLCSFPVRAGSVFAQSATAIIIPVTTTRFIDTVPSDTSVNTVLQVRNSSLATLCSDDAYGLGTKSKVKPLPGSSSTSFKILVGARANTSPTSVIRVYINY